MLLFRFFGAQKGLKGGRGESNLRFLRSDLFLPPFSKTCPVTSAQANISQSWKLKTSCVWKYFEKWEILGATQDEDCRRLLLPTQHERLTLFSIELGEKNIFKVCFTTNFMLLPACKIWGVYIRQEIVKYLSGPFIPREKYMYNFTTVACEYRWRKGFEILKKVFLCTTGCCSSILGQVKSEMCFNLFNLLSFAFKEAT